MTHEGQHREGDDESSVSRRVHPVVFIAGAVTVIGVVAAVVVLSLAGRDPAPALAAALPVLGLLLTALDKLAKGLDETRAQTRTLALIDDRTNGTLDRRISRAVTKALDDRLGPPPANRAA